MRSRMGGTATRSTAWLSDTAIKVHTIELARHEGTHALVLPRPEETCILVLALTHSTAWLFDTAIKVRGHTR